MAKLGWTFTKPEWCEFVDWYMKNYKGILHKKDYMQYWRYERLIEKWRREKNGRKQMA